MTQRSPQVNEGELLLGVAYYHEYHQEHRLEKDLDLMVRAGINVIRVGESVWSTWEPSNNRFDLEWLMPVIDAAHERGIKVILGTPTYAIPPWLQVAYPEIAAEWATGVRSNWGARQEMNTDHPAYWFHAERVIRRIMERYASHPAIIGFQVDNEPAGGLLYNQGVFSKFLTYLRETYGDVETLNREWGLVYWSHRLNDWSELWRPDGNTFPQYDLAWRKFQATLHNDFIAWQADIVREYARDDQFVMTCVQYSLAQPDDRGLFERLDVTAGNPYYGSQDRLDETLDIASGHSGTTAGVATGILRQGDRMYSSKQARYLVTETNAQATDNSDANFPPYDGQLKQAAYALVARGASLIEYWHWHTIPFGAETYWGGVIPHSLEPGRVYEEVAQIGAGFQALGTTLDGYVPDSDITMLWSTPSRYGLQKMPPFTDTTPGVQPFDVIFDSFHRGVIDAGLQARILHVEQAQELGVATLVAEHPILVAAGLYVLDDNQLELLRQYVTLGGHLIVGPRTGYADHEARARVEVAPPRLADLAGVTYSEFSNIDASIRLTEGLGEGASSGEATRWIDGLRPTEADVLASYEHPHFKKFAAVTTRDAGQGRITVVGTVLDRASSRDLIASIVPPAGRNVTSTAQAVTVASGRTAAAEISFAFNWSWEPNTVSIARDSVDALTGEQFTAGSNLELGAWDVRVLTSEIPAEGEQS